MQQKQQQGAALPEASAPTPDGARPQPLPALRQDLRLHPAAPLSDGSPTWRIYDPVRNAFFEIGWLEFELLSRWRDHESAEALVAAVAGETTLRPTLDEVQDVVEFLAQNELLAAQGQLARKVLQSHLDRSRHGWLTQALHHYLFFRIPLLRPDRFLANTIWLTDIFFTRAFAVVVVCVFGLDLYLVSREWFAFTDALSRMFTPSLAIYYPIALVFAKLIHELAHAYAARRYGVRVPTMGLAFLVLAPFPYTDTGETWKLGDRHKQLVIASAGMVAELVLAVFSTLLWAVSPEGAVRNILFVLASSTWIMTLAVNLSPFMRFDGYFVLSDLLNFPNLHERAGACAKWWLRRTFFGIEAAMPEPSLTPRQRAGLIAFAYVTWIYRLTVFIGIALLVYHMFFKLLGLFLFLVEIVWFVILPFWREGAFLWRSRAQVHPRWRALAAGAAVLALFMWTVPVSKQVTAPAVLRAAQEHAVYAPFPARVRAVEVSEGQSVQAEGGLIELEGTDLPLRLRKADITIASTRVALSRTPASQRLQETYGVLQEQLAQAMAEKQAVAEETERQSLRAPEDGVVRDVARDLVPGRWVSPREQLMRIVSDRPVIEAYVGERQVEAVAPGQRVNFYPASAFGRVIRGQVIAVDKWPQKALSQRMLASTHGGEIVVKAAAAGGGLIAQDAIFRVLIAPTEGEAAVGSVTRGEVRIETDLRFVAENFIYRIISVVIREGGA